MDSQLKDNIYLTCPAAVGGWFENILWSPNGNLVPNNETLVSHVANRAHNQGRKVASAPNYIQRTIIPALPNTKKTNFNKAIKQLYT